MEGEQLHKTPEQVIERRFGKETLAAAEGYARSVSDTIKDALAQMSFEEGSTREQDEHAREYLSMWRNFLSGLFARTSSVNATSPEIVATVMEGANSLLSVESTREGKAAAKKMVEALKKRYGV